MASLIPAFFTAKEDVVLRGNPFLVYLWMHDHLDVVDYRAVKILEVVAALEMRETTARHAVRLLIERGYLDRRKTEDYSDRRWCYRLIYSVAASEAPNLPKRRQNSA
jgi:predicted DNA-binding transcriptional regulator